MKTVRAFSLVVAALCAVAAGPATAQDVVKIGVLNDMSGVYSDDQGPGSVLAAQMAVEDFGGSAAGRKIEVLSGRPPEQARHRRPDRPALVRQRGRRRDGRPAELGGRARGRRHRARPQQGDDRLGRRQLADDRAEVHAQHGALDLRHLGLRPRARPRRDRRRASRAVYFITADYAFGHDLEKQFTDEASSNRAARCSARRAIRSARAISLVPAAGAGLGRRCGGVRQCGRRHHQLAQAGRASSASPRSRSCWR